MPEVKQEDEQSDAVKGKPDSITVHYIVSSSLHIPDLEKEHKFLWSAVKDWWVKWDDLHLIVHGSEKEGERHIIIEIGTDNIHDTGDMKRPASCTLYDADYNCLEEG
jgi:hypothetical protein